MFPTVQGNTMQKNYDVTALGELLIDFTPAGRAETGSAIYECNPGGAPANVLTAVSRLGGHCGFMGKVGEDSFGHLLHNTLVREGIDTAGLLFDGETRTTLAFVTLDGSGNRAFSFFRNPGADIMLKAEEVCTEMLTNTRIFHFGSLSCTHEPARSATRFAAETAKAAGARISYDPNLRLPLWKNPETAKKTILEFMPYADIVKMSEEEFTFLTGEADYTTHAAHFAAQYGIALLLVTLGPGGAYYYHNGKSGRFPTYDVPVADTTGSGDAFTGAVLRQLCQLDTPLEALTEQALEKMIRFANAAGSITATAKGGIPAIPNTAQVQNCMKQYPLLTEK